MTDEPQYQHDCDECTFLGQYGNYDLYFCTQGGGYRSPTVIARYGNDGPEYTSGMIFAGSDPLKEALQRANEAGLVETK